MTGWHASDHLVTRYAAGSLPESDAWSLEKHLESCGGCAARVSRAVRETAAGVVLADLREAVLRAGEWVTEGDSAARGTRPTPDAHLAPTPWDARASETPPAPASSAARSATACSPASARPGTPVPSTAATLAAAALPATAEAEATSPAPTTDPESAAPAPPAKPATATPTAPFTRARLWAARHLTPPPVGSRTARVLWAAGPAMRGAWAVAVLGVAVAAIVLARFADFAGARPLLLAVAPVVPLAGVALSYGAHADPLHEIAAATPSAGLRLVLTRTAAVLAVSLPLLTLAGLLVPASGAPGAAAWLLPGLALTLASVALAGYTGFRTATAVTGGGWLCAVLAPVLTADGRPAARLAEQVSACLDGAPAQGGWAAGAVLCAALLTARRSAYDRLERR